MSVSRLLSEANLFSQVPLFDAVRAVLAEKAVAAPEILAWFEKQWAAAYAASLPDNDRRVRKHQPDEGDPEWADKTVDFVQLSPDDLVSIKHTVDYFNSLSEGDLRKIYKEPLAVIKAKVAAWDKKMLKDAEKRPTRADVEGTDYTTVYSYSNGYKMVELTSQEAYVREGQQMGHCVGTYIYKKGHAQKIWSLRDPLGNPHVTLELNHWSNFDADGHKEYFLTLVQVQGKGNTIPLQKYLRLTKECTDHAGVRLAVFPTLLEQDLKNGLVSEKEFRVALSHAWGNPQACLLIYDYNHGNIDRKALLKGMAVAGAQSPDPINIVNASRIKDLAAWSDNERTQLLHHGWMSAEDSNLLKSLGVVND